MLGVTVTNHLSVSEHVRDVISRCAQSIYALKLLRSRGMNDDELRTIYKSVVLAKLLYAVPAWWPGLHHGRWQETVGSVRSTGVRLNLYLQYEPTITQLVGQHENSLSQVILDDESHVIHHLLPPSVSNTYNVRPRRHQRQLTIKLDNKNFLIRKLYEDIY